ncbi:MAG TPA: response regulator transcription factor [Anaerolineaceae bacterium]|nr:response regulator transcription factor [Anaerolineaceae bacterium]HOD03645.1 response regulator transcription factor [Anaerolineaceae bacterium]
MKSSLILLVDDEPSIVALARLYLEREGFTVQSVADGSAALEAVNQLQPALVVLDVMLPELDGFEVCRRLRAAGSSVAILMLTAREEDIDKILGLELGADDYMTKPFNPRELVARVKSILRRIERVDYAQTGEIFRLGNLLIDPDRREVRVNGNMVEMRAQEFEVLWVLAKHCGKVLSREQLLNLAWGFDFYGQTRTVDMHIAQLRRRLANSTVHIETVTGVGYKLVG